MPILPQHASAGAAAARRYAQHSSSSSGRWITANRCMKALVLFLAMSAVGLVSISLMIAGKTGKADGTIAGGKLLSTLQEGIARKFRAKPENAASEGVESEAAPAASAPPDASHQRRTSTYAKDTEVGKHEDSQNSAGDENAEAETGADAEDTPEADAVVPEEIEQEQPVKSSPKGPSSFFGGLFSRKLPPQEQPEAGESGFAGSTFRSSSADGPFSFEGASTPRQLTEVQSRASTLAPQLLFLMATGSAEQNALLPSCGPSLPPQPAPPRGTSNKGSSSLEVAAPTPVLTDIRVLLAQPYPAWASDLASSSQRSSQPSYSSSRWVNTNAFGLTGNDDEEEEEDGSAEMASNDEEADAGGDGLSKVLGKVFKAAELSAQEDNKQAMRKKAKDEKSKQGDAGSGQGAAGSAAETDEADEEERRLLDEVSAAASLAREEAEEDEDAEGKAAKRGKSSKGKAGKEEEDSNDAEKEEDEDGDEAESAEGGSFRRPFDASKVPVTDPRVSSTPHYSAFADGIYYNASSSATSNPFTNDSSPLPLSFFLQAYDDDTLAATQAMALASELVYAQTLRASLFAHYAGLKVNPALYTAPAAAAAPVSTPPATSATASTGSKSSAGSAGNTASGQKSPYGAARGSVGGAQTFSKPNNVASPKEEAKPPSSSAPPSSPLSLAAFAPSALSLRLKVEARQQKRALALVEGCSRDALLPALEALASQAQAALQPAFSSGGLFGRGAGANDKGSLISSAQLNSSLVELASRCSPFLYDVLLKDIVGNEDGMGAETEETDEQEGETLSGPADGLSLALDPAAPLPPSALTVPFFVHSGELNVGLGPILVMGAGDGHLALRIAQALPENTVVGVHFSSGGGATQQAVFERHAQTALGITKLAAAVGCSLPDSPLFAEARARNAAQSSSEQLALLPSSDITSTMKRLLAVPNLWTAELPTLTASGPGSSSAGPTAVERLVAYLHARSAESSPLQYGYGGSDKDDGRGFSLGLVVLTPSTLARLYAESSLFNPATTAEASKRGKKIAPPSPKAEFESLLGRILTLSRYVILPSSLPDEASLVRDPYFSRLPDGETPLQTSGDDDCGIASVFESADGSDGEAPASAGTLLAKVTAKLEEKRVKLLRQRIKRVAKFFRKHWPAPQSTGGQAGTGMDTLIDGAVKSVGLTATVRPLGSLTLPFAQDAASSSSSSDGSFKNTGMLVVALQRADEAEAEEDAYAEVSAAEAVPEPQVKATGFGGGRSSFSSPSFSGSKQQPEERADYQVSVSSLLAQPDMARVIYPLAAAYAKLAPLHPASTGTAAAAPAGKSTGFGGKGSANKRSSAPAAPSAPLDYSAFEAATILGLPAPGSSTSSPSSSSAASAESTLARLPRALKALADDDMLSASGADKPLSGGLASAVGVPLDVLLAIGLGQEDTVELTRLTTMAAAAPAAQKASSKGASRRFTVVGGRVFRITAPAKVAARALTIKSADIESLTQTALDIIKTQGAAKGLRMASADDMQAPSGAVHEQASPRQPTTQEEEMQQLADDEAAILESIDGLLLDEGVTGNEDGDEDADRPIGGLKKQKAGKAGRVPEAAAPEAPLSKAPTKKSAPPAPSVPAKKPLPATATKGKSELTRLAEALKRSSENGKGAASGKRSPQSKTDAAAKEPAETIASPVASKSSAAKAKPDAPPKSAPAPVVTLVEEAAPSEIQEVPELTPEIDDTLIEELVGDDALPEANDPVAAAAADEAALPADVTADVEQDVDEAAEAVAGEEEQPEEVAEEAEAAPRAATGPRALLEVGSPAKRGSLRSSTPKSATAPSAAAPISVLASAFQRPTSWADIRPVVVPSGADDDESPSASRNALKQPITLYSFHGLSQLSPKRRELRKRRLQLLHSALSETEGASFTRWWSFLQQQGRSSGASKSAVGSSQADATTEFLLHGSSPATDESSHDHSEGSTEPASSILIAGSGSPVLLGAKLARSLQKTSSPASIFTLFPQGGTGLSSLASSAASLHLASAMYGGHAGAAVGEAAVSNYYADLTAEAEDEEDDEEDEDPKEAAATAQRLARERSLTTAHLSLFPYYYGAALLKSEMQGGTGNGKNNKAESELMPKPPALSSLLRTTSASSSTSRRAGSRVSASSSVQQELITHLLSQRATRKDDRKDTGSVFSMVGGADLSTSLAKALLLPTAQDGSAPPFTHLFLTGHDAFLDGNLLSSTLASAEGELLKALASTSATAADAAGLKAATKAIEIWSERFASLLALSSKQAMLELPAGFNSALAQAVQAVLVGKHYCRPSGDAWSSGAESLPCAFAALGTATPTPGSSSSALATLEAMIAEVALPKELAPLSGAGNSLPAAKVASTESLLRSLSLAVPALWAKEATAGAASGGVSLGGGWNAKGRAVQPAKAGSYDAGDSGHGILLSSLDVIFSALTGHTAHPVATAEQAGKQGKQARGGKKETTARALVYGPRSFWWQLPASPSATVGSAVGRRYSEKAAAQSKKQQEAHRLAAERAAAKKARSAADEEADDELLFSFTKDRADDERASAPSVADQRIGHSSSRSRAETSTQKPQPRLTAWEPLKRSSEGFAVMSGKPSARLPALEELAVSRFAASFEDAVTDLLKRGASRMKQGGLPFQASLLVTGEGEDPAAHNTALGLVASALEKLAGITSSAAITIGTSADSSSILLAIERVAAAPGGADLDAVSGLLSLHTVLSLQPSPATRSALAGMMMSLPIQAIARDALQQGSAVGPADDVAQRFLSISPSQLYLSPTASNGGCRAQLEFSVPQGSSFHSRLSMPCVSHSNDPSVSSTDPDDQDLHLLEVWGALSSQLLPLDTASGGAADDDQGDTSLERYGRFSFVDVGSGVGSISLLTAKAFPNATVLSIESSKARTDAHLAAAIRAGISNNLIGTSQSTVGDSSSGVSTQELLKRIYESPEFFRYLTYGLTPNGGADSSEGDGNMVSGSLERVLLELLSLRNKGAAATSQQPSSLLSSVLAAVGTAQSIYGTVPALAVTSFVRAPPAALVSLLFTTFHDIYNAEASGWLLDAGGAGAVVSTPLRISGSVEIGSGRDRTAPSRCPPSLWQWPSSSTKCVARQLGLDAGPDGHLSSPLTALLGKKERRGNDDSLSSAYSFQHHPRGQFAQAEVQLVSSLLQSSSQSRKREDRIIEVDVAAVPAVTSLPYFSSVAAQAIDNVLAPPKLPLTQLSLSSWASALANPTGLPRSLLSTAPTPRGSSGPLLLPLGISSGVVRMDVKRLTRHVNHHYQSSIDGHTRTYTLHVQQNVTASAVLSRHILRQRKADVMALHGDVSESLKRLVDGKPESGRGARSSSIDEVYRHLPPGNHPNHGLTTAGDAVLILKAALANLVEEQRIEKEKEERERLEEAKREQAEAVEARRKGKKVDPSAAKKKPKKSKKGKKSAPSGGGGSRPAVELNFPIVSEQLQRGFELITTPPSAPVALKDLLPGVVSIILTRDMDGAFIPYTSVHGITLISLLRLGLLPALRTRAYHQFVSLPLYLDMAPWNIVARGSNLDYIDFDTKDRTFDKQVEQAYQVMEVLFNYKRTLEDFKRCQGKGSNPYGFPFVSECVGGSGSYNKIDGGKPLPSCSDSRLPVPCSDGACHSSYISCLRSISAQERLKEGRSSIAWAVEQKVKAAQGKRDEEDAGENGEDETASADEADEEDEVTEGADASPDDRQAKLRAFQEAMQGLAGEANDLTKQFLGGLGGLQTDDRAAKEVPVDEDEEEEEQEPAAPAQTSRTESSARSRAGAPSSKKLGSAPKSKTPKLRKKRAAPLPLMRSQTQAADGDE